MTDRSGEAVESDEVIPRWFADGRAAAAVACGTTRSTGCRCVLAGEHVTAAITFADDCATVAGIDPDLGSRAATVRPE